MIRKNFASGTPWEGIVGYSRAVLIGDQLEISGTVAVNEKGVVGKGDVFKQTQYILEKITNVLSQAGFSLQDVIRTRIYVKEIEKWEEVGRAHGLVFGSIKPATSLIEVKGLIHPDYLVEIEATARKVN